MIISSKQTQQDQIDKSRKHREVSSPLPICRLAPVNSWGGASKSLGYLYRPSDERNLREVFELARRHSRPIALRGAGNSYGDAAMNNENIVVDLRRMNRILEWDPTSGIIKVEPGVTIAQLWEYSIEDGWWPAVVPGTAKPTIGGCAGMNVHGKNAWKVGPIGDHIESFELLLPNGEVLICSRQQNQELFYSAIGGLGMLGTFLSITLRLARIESGLLEVHALASHSLAEMFQQFDAYLDESDYLVGWIDGFAKGNSLGRGQIHRANYLSADQDPLARKTLRADHQHLSDTMFGVFPRSAMWRFMRPFFNDVGARFINLGKYLTSLYGDDSRFQQPHVAFHFLLDYVPNFKRAYGRSGLIQYQCFVPEETAQDAFTEILRRCQARKIVNYLSVFKRHRTDDFLLSHGVNGYSLAMDFRITSKNRERVRVLASELDQIVLEARGRFYFAKDSTLTPSAVESFLGVDVVNQFKALKRRYDPDYLLQTNMWRRLFLD